MWKKSKSLHPNVQLYNVHVSHGLESGDKATYLSINFYLSELLLKVISTEIYFNALLISGEMEFDIDNPDISGSI